ncbi:hypothetical protein FCU45_00675 [Sulfurimonas crateris]|uniref:Uncharacterized protein n=1 Tax=Sulfurimonas crateris TaxID=2574727 RepID=A0A4U2Z9E6_9BACT|nr:hypothetical protein [Sulfurimonas crateris]TKI70938.1 hypothetical protein FCU45_00675 [Sulfurimonas crateris]
MMIINNLQTGYNAYNSNLQNQTLDPKYAESTTERSKKTDRVTISDEAKQLLKTSENTTSQSTDTLPVEAYSLPSWFQDYIVPSNEIGEINYDFWNFVGTLTNDNMLAGDEKSQIKEYLQKDSKHQQSLANDKFITEHKTEIESYGSLLENYFQEALQENGVISNQDYYNKVILDKESSEIIHQNMAKKIESDRRIQELMNILGVK